MTILVMALLGLCFGSFVNALVWRLHEKSLPPKKRKASAKDLSIARGRSMCVHCGHTLKTIDLIPVLSWLTLRGKCRYCKKPVSWQYPAVELLTAAAFVLSFIFWPRELEGWEMAAFGMWLVSLVGLIALLVYDLRWMLLPNKIIFPLYGVAALFVASRMAAEGSIQPLFEAIGGVAVGGGLFYLLFQGSRGRWIGGGDVKLGFLLGALAGNPLDALLTLFIASLLGSVLLLPLMVLGKAERGTRIPFGPFLIIGLIIVQLAGDALIDWYTSYFIDI